ncbi:MAG: hypothetical protein EHM48_00600 [Planctomycetaceae bacterium]|nr:MAG: hypothetical protein EHM48_00600 [Planctomycetaceae bacterium]
MALKIHCARCKKRIAVDEAFAGGVCRCPYCKALILVRGTIADATGPRPDSPDVRPDEPAGRPVIPPDLTISMGQPVLDNSTPPTQDQVPTAQPVKMQGVVWLILLGMTLATIVVIVILVIK